MIKNGFTLIELLVTVAIIGIIATAGLTLLNPVAQLNKANDSKRKADLAQLQAALELYRSDQGSYPASLPPCSSSLTAGGTTYMKSVPCDPTRSTPYNYAPSGSPIINYTFIACLQNIKDPQKDVTNNNSYCSGSGSSWSYTVTNP